MKKHQRVIVVLGMHRSGTSVMARSLQVMGVELGKNLMPPLPGNNDTGFWEDLDINSLNIEMLNSLKTDWYYLSPIQNSDVNLLANRGYVQRAMDLLDKKTANCELFGFKDPRTAKLLPFWLEVFRQGQFDVSYVISIRNPLSVCRSLAKRDGFETERGAFLWLEHVLSSLTGTVGDNRVLVDYDEFMQSPKTELERMAVKLQLQINPAEFEKFKKEFLKDELRHTFFKIDDLNREEMPQLTYDVYTTLLSEDLDSPTLSGKLGEWNKHFAKQKNAFTLVDSVTSKVVSLEQVVAGKENQLRETENQLREMGDKFLETERVLNEIYHSKTWRVALILRRLRTFLIPTRRNK